MKWFADRGKKGVWVWHAAAPHPHPHLIPNHLPAHSAPTSPTTSPTTIPNHLPNPQPSPCTPNPQVGDMVRGRVLVGHAIGHDLKALRLEDHPRTHLRDTSKWPGLMKTLPNGRKVSASLKVRGRMGRAAVHAKGACFSVGFGMWFVRCVRVGALLTCQRGVDWVGCTRGRKACACRKPPVPNPPSHASSPSPRHLPFPAPFCPIPTHPYPSLSLPTHPCHALLSHSLSPPTPPLRT